MTMTEQPRSLSSYAVERPAISAADDRDIGLLVFLKWNGLRCDGNRHPKGFTGHQLSSPIREATGPGVSGSSRRRPAGSSRILGLLRFADVVRLRPLRSGASPEPAIGIMQARNESPVPELEHDLSGDAAIDSLDLSQHELRSRRIPWMTPPSRRPLTITGGFRCDVLVIGAGITGALVAERLTREGREVVLVDRGRPGEGSTLASTAMLLWEIDRSLSELTELYGFERATRGYRASLSAVRGLKRLVAQLQLKCLMRDREALYLAAGDDPEPLRKEAELRSRAGLPGLFLDHRAVKIRFGFEPPGAIPLHPMPRTPTPSR